MCCSECSVGMGWSSSVPSGPPCRDRLDVNALMWMCEQPLPHKKGSMMYCIRGKAAEGHHYCQTELAIVIDQEFLLRHICHAKVEAAIIPCLPHTVPDADWRFFRCVHSNKPWHAAQFVTTVSIFHSKVRYEVQNYIIQHDVLTRCIFNTFATTTHHGARRLAELHKLIVW